MTPENGVLLKNYWFTTRTYSHNAGWTFERTRIPSPKWRLNWPTSPKSKSFSALNFNDEKFFELALMLKYGTIKVLLFWKSKPTVRPMNTNWTPNYSSWSTRIKYSRTIRRSTNLVGRNLLNKVDCSQAYHCQQSAIQKSIEIRAFIFGQPNFCLQTRNIRSKQLLTAFWSSMNEFWGPGNKMNQCAQFVEDVKISTNPQKSSSVCQNHIWRH